MTKVKKNEILVKVKKNEKDPPNFFSKQDLAEIAEDLDREWQAEIEKKSAKASKTG